MMDFKHFVDKSGWGFGPWQEEPDRATWWDQATGLPCLISRNGFGSLCGYVGVHPKHPLFNSGIGSCLNKICCNPYSCDHSLGYVITVHGGLSFAGECKALHYKNEGCHLKDEVTKEPWWFGFDCGHSIDYIPFLNVNLPGNYPSNYRDLKYVESQIEQLANQLFELGV